ncbi:MAG: hypothetical protein EHM24_06655 [Acidobacteria bacterium]|nr:MAG: hypothetical protein EHM24_25770 [Acidobacteriota bacterium]RPJ74138.1 MAG: hypothetical protein EHM24_06655 [Acidobacteriota bacterium]
MEISDIRRRVRTTLEETRKASAERRARSEAAQVAYRAFLRDIATPVFRMFGNVLKAEGHSFTIHTPPESVRLVSDRHDEDYIEVWLDTSVDPPEVATRSNVQRGRDMISREGLLRPGASIVALTDEDVLAYLLGEIGRVVER